MTDSAEGTPNLLPAAKLLGTNRKADSTASYTSDPCLWQWKMRLVSTCATETIGVLHISKSRYHFWMSTKTVTSICTSLHVLTFAPDKRLIGTLTRSSEGSYCLSWLPEVAGNARINTSGRIPSVSCDDFHSARGYHRRNRVGVVAVSAALAAPVIQAWLTSFFVLLIAYSGLRVSGKKGANNRS